MEGVLSDLFIKHLCLYDQFRVSGVKIKMTPGTLPVPYTIFYRWFRESPAAVSRIYTIAADVPDCSGMEMATMFVPNASVMVASA